ncbi:Synaptotagmin-4 [Hibiscus syriacus]|uniref:Synaptotagmin-4 n=1 Tax=Hibiscus syriacus TaxID=106335 RepID=A0A6A2XFA9_HIBSY|nr:Synaptotagmin-4 [Hibiscus syriacus]
MAFLYAMFIGLTTGIGLIVAFARYEKVRSSRRAHMAKTVASFARMTVQDTRKILPQEFYPPWLVWLNVQLKKIWPYFNEAASELIRASVEPTLEQYTPAVISSMKFGKLTLGTIAPQFTGVSIVESESDEGGITMELEIKWDGNPNIVLNINTRLGVSLPVQKDLDFILKVVGGDLSTIPGISDAIEDTIRNAIEDSITWPVRKIIPVLPGDYSDLELRPVGVLDVKLVQAKDLANKDMIGKSDPFAELFVRPLRHKMKTSKTINNTLNPIWNEHFEFIVEDASTQHLTVRVFDDEGLQAPELVGCAHVALKDLEPGKVKDIRLKLVKDLVVQRDTKNRGLVQLELLYCPFGTESSFKNPFNPDFSLTSLEKALKTATAETEAVDLDKIMNQRKSDVIVRGVLSVTVIAAEDLPAVDILGKADPFVIITLKKSEAKATTRVANETLNPVWDHTFDFVVEDALHEMIILEVWDYDTLKKEKIGRCIMTLTRVLLEGEVQDTFELDGAKSGRLLLHLKWTPQLVFRDA